MTRLRAKVCPVCRPAVASVGVVVLYGGAVVELSDIHNPWVMFFGRRPRPRRGVGRRRRLHVVTLFRAPS